MLIELKDVNKTYNNGQPLHVLKGINLVINDGEIAEMGTHEELLDKKGAYFALYSSQFKRA